jgi:prevent-host-death family protein
MIHPKDIHTLTEFKRNSAELLQRLEENDCTQVLVVDGKPKAVLLSIKVYERLVDEIEKAETLEGIHRGLADVEAGRTMSLAEAEAELRKRLGLPRKKGSKSA